MAWLKRLFGIDKSQAKKNTAQAPQTTNDPTAGQASSRQQVPPERVGLNGEYDESGLAKRVALAFDEDSQLSDIDTVYVAQTGSKVVLKGKVPNQQMLSRLVSTAQRVNGATTVDTSQVSIG